MKGVVSAFLTYDKRGEGMQVTVDRSETGKCSRIDTNRVVAAI